MPDPILKGAKGGRAHMVEGGEQRQVLESDSSTGTVCSHHVACGGSGIASYQSHLVSVFPAGL